MTKAARRQRTWAIAASALAHVAVLVTALAYRPHLTSPVETAAGPAETVIPVYLTPRSHLTRAQAQAGAAAPLSGAPPTPPSAAASAASALPPREPAAPAQAPAAAASAGPIDETPPAPDLRAALRHGALGCANLMVAGMTRDEQANCQERLGRSAAAAPYIPTPLQPRMRHYYDQVALAKTHDAPAMPIDPTHSPIPGDPPPHAANAGHIPMIGCYVPFGPGEKPKLPAHWLKLGPCFIAPPKGPFTQEVDITPP